MYCSHCGYDLDQNKMQKALKKNTLTSTKRSPEAKDVFNCPRCQHVIKENLSEEEYKDLARAAHSEIHRGRNNNNSGLCFGVISFIVLAISFMFLSMSFKATAGHTLVLDSVEFTVFLVLLSIGLVALTYAIIQLVLGIKKIRKYNGLLTRIQNETFYQ